MGIIHEGTWHLYAYDSGRYVGDATPEQIEASLTSVWGGAILIDDDGNVLDTGHWTDNHPGARAVCVALMSGVAAARIRRWVVTYVDEAASMGEDELDALTRYLWCCGARGADGEDLFDFKGEVFHGDELAEMLEDAAEEARKP